MQQNGNKNEKHKMINGMTLRVDVTRKVSREEENTTIIVEDENNTCNLEESGIDNGTIKIPVATDYDIDCDYDYIMARALKSYRQHREKEKADTRKMQLRDNFLKRPYPRPKTAPLTRFTAAMRPPLLAKFPRPDSALVPRGDAITEVQRANLTQEDIRQNKRVLQVATVNINTMMEMNSKSRSYMKRNEGSHCWYSNSYPDVKSINNNMRVRAPHAYTSASVGDRDLSLASSLSSSRSSSTKSSPSHPAGKPRGSVKPQYNYDGGLFAIPRNGPKDDFVIHPDWVSESMSIQKLSLSKRTASKPVQNAVKDPRMTKSMTWPGRRCKSAPPSKLRNPITWEAKDG